MRPPRKVRPFSFLHTTRQAAKKSSRRNSAAVAKPARTHDHHAGAVLLRNAIPRAPLPLPSVFFAPQHVHSASLFYVGPRTPLPPPAPGRPRWSRSTHSAFFLFRVPTLFLAGCSFFVLAAHCAARHARSHARSLARVRTDDRRTNDATCGPPAWLTGTLHDGGTQSVRSPLWRAPLLATLFAMPLHCGRL